MNALIVGAKANPILPRVATGFRAAGVAAEVLGHGPLDACEARRWWRGRAVRAFNEELFAIADGGPFDLVLLIDGEAVTSETVELLRDDTPVVLWSLGGVPAPELAAAVDTRFSTDFANRSTKYLPLPCEPETFHPLDDVAVDTDVAVVGPVGGARLAVLEELAAAAAAACFDFRVFGRYEDESLAGEWPHLFAALAHDAPMTPAEINGAYNRAHLVVDLVAGDEDLLGRMPRVCGAMAAGAFVLTNRVDGLDAFFIPGVEFDTYSDVGAFVVKVQRWLANDEDRRRRVAVAREQVLGCHTWEQRARQLLAAVDLK